jgi:MFS family permease
MVASRNDLWLYCLGCRNNLFPNVCLHLKVQIRYTISTNLLSVMSGLGKDSTTTLLLTTPPYLIGTIVVLIAAWHADKTGERYLHIALPPLLAIACFILAVTTTSFAPRYV